MGVTGGAIIKRAYRFAGMLARGQTVRGEDEAEGLQELRLLVSQLGLVPPMQFNKTTTVYALAAVDSVTVGPGGQIDIARPWRVEDESFVRVSGQDYDLAVLDRARYNEILQKQQGGSWPAGVWLEPAVPLAILHPWPIGACELHLVTLAAIGVFVDVTTEHDLPDGYEDALGLMLGERLANLNEVPLTAEKLGQVRTAQRIIERTNISVPQLDIGLERIDTRTAFLSGE